MFSLLQDFRYALRQLRKSPGFTLTAITVLALGLGANVAVFTVLNGVLLRPLPYPQADRIVKVDLAGAMPYYAMRYANIIQLRDAVGPTVKIGETFDQGMVSIVTPGGRLQAGFTTVGADLFSMLGVQPVLGRAFRDEENQPGNEGVVLIGNDVWRKFYAADRNVIGKTMTMHGHVYSIIGVMPRGFSFPFGESMQVWTPEPLATSSRSAMGKGMIIGDMFARLPQGMSEAQLSAALNHAQAIVAKTANDDDVPAQVKMTEYRQMLNEGTRKPLWLLYGVVIGIWVLACLNLTSLMLARAISRTREHAVRSALGASRIRLLQQAIVESFLVSFAGAAIALLIGVVAIRLLSHQIEQSLPVKNTVHLDWRVVAWLGVLSVLTALVAGIYPALRAMRREVRQALHGATTSGSKRQNRTREILVVGQLALTLVFLVGAGLFLRTIHALRQAPLGFTQQNVLTGGIALNTVSNYHNEQTNSQTDVVKAYYLPLLDRVRAIPGVKVAALSSVLPLRSEFAVTIMGQLDHKHTSDADAPMADGRLASPGLVDALGIPMRRGRFFTEQDTASSPAVVVVNQAFASKYLPGQDPIGHTFRMGDGRFADMRIVGVIGDVKQKTVVDPTKPEMYFCLSQMERGTPLYGITGLMQVAIRGAVPAEMLRTQFDKVLHEVAPDATTTNVKTIHEAVEDSFGSQTLIAELLEGFAALALMIASIGLYGLLSFAVAQRTREIGVRMALGAQQGNILGLVLRRAMLLVAVGLVCGGTMAWFAVRFARSYLYGVAVHDALTFGVVAVVLALASILAAWLPARRAASVDPILALRSE